MAELAGKSAVILGVSSEKGLGEVIARLFAAEGAKVVVSGRRMEPLQALAADIGGSAVTCDIGDDDQIKAMFDHAAATYGNVDIAVNAAGVNAPTPLAELSRDTLQTMTDIHFIGPTMFIKQAAAAMPNGGSIMTLSSVTVELAAAGLAPYVGPKAGTDRIVQVAAQEYGPQGIRVNSISPGLTRTPMTEQFFQVPSILASFEKETPIGRMPTADNVAFAALYLASDRCIATGDNIRVSGGAHLRRMPTAEEMMGGG